MAKAREREWPERTACAANDEPGQPAEVTLATHPGRVFKAKVKKIAYMTAQGQLKPTGDVTSAEQFQALPLGVVLELDEEAAVDLPLTPGGAIGTAAIYTSQVKAAHVIRRVMIRMQAWMNYVIPR